ncbi:hypothetical protein [Kitasatospora sp. NBC_01302]|uniref:hypothetical protein n=1 Tax=Kitasatospora sp. NBC_01302 TaxID=2903575 RepID=UPI002E12396A|nr:hypothetical protein OG294_39555 [Kitasatospora sp. NBC_01302]
MTAFLSALGDKLAERWLTLLAVPGLLYLMALGAAVTLGQRHWHDVGRLRARLDALAAAPAAHSPGTVAVAALGVLAGAAAVGTAAQQLGGWVEKAWLVEVRGPLTGRLAARRLRRWQAADADYRTALVAAGRARIAEGADAGALAHDAERRYAARNRIGSAAPRHAFWTGDRIAAPDQRVWRSYRLDLTVAWPHLWLLAPDGTRAELDTARTGLASATRLIAWGAGYAVLSLWWWPAAPIGALAVATGVGRGRAAAASFADLAEALVDLHGKELALALGLECEGALTRTVGEAVTRALSKPG